MLRRNMLSAAAEAGRDDLINARLKSTRGTSPSSTMARCLGSLSIASTALVVAVYYVSYNSNKAQLNYPRRLAVPSSLTDPKHVTSPLRNPITNSLISTDESAPSSITDPKHVISPLRNPITNSIISTHESAPSSLTDPKHITSPLRNPLTNNIIPTHEWPWPTAEIPHTPEGTYVSKNTPHHLSTQTTTGNTGRVLLYITSHMSQHHEMFLKYCWPNILANSTLLQEADVAVYLNPEEEKRKEAMDLLKNTFAGQNLKVYLRSNQGYNNGAKMAMYEAVTSKFFVGYDWIIRLNPDVIIRDDSFLIQSMADPSVSALLINCSRQGGAGAIVHTDFFVIDPDMLHADAFTWKNVNAERSFTKSISKSILEKGSHRWIPNAAPASMLCRAGQGRPFHESPIVHEHVLHPDICSVPSDIQ